MAPDMYFIPKLWSNNISIRQLDELGWQVLIIDGVLVIHDKDHHLLAKVNRSTNRLYKIDIWASYHQDHVPGGALRLRHEALDARFGHLSFDVMRNVARLLVGNGASA
jgi:hypothetical protein